MISDKKKKHLANLAERRRNGDFPHSQETKDKIGKANKGNTGYWKGKKLSEDTKRRISESRKALFSNGENAHNFKGGGWMYWKRVISERDNHTCVYCGLEDERIMHVAHIKPIKGIKNRNKNGHPLNSFQNLVCLCPNCHSLFDKGFINKKDIEKYAKKP